MLRTYAAFNSKYINSETSCLIEVEACLQAIREAERFNIFLEVYEEEALQRASELDKQRAQGKVLPCSGMVVSIKDTLCYKGHKVTAASKMLGNFTSLYTATVVQRLLDAGAIIIGRVNCDEFAMGSSNENSAFGPVGNPAAEGYVPGGSSGGSAASVAAGCCHISLGSDTGGSVRQPAAFCGVSGLRPTYGRLSRYGLFAFASSFDQVGPIGSSLDDIALATALMSGNDPSDCTSADGAVSISSSVQEATKGLKIGLLSDCIYIEGIHPEIKEAVGRTSQLLQHQGHQVEEVSFPFMEQMIPVYYTLATAEASSNLSRYSGVGYGFRADDVHNTAELFKRSRSQGFGKEVQRRIMLGTFVLSESYYDAYYSKAQKVRRVITDYTNALLTQYDALLLPTTPTPPFKPGEKVSDPVSMYLSDVLTIQAAIAGIPAISIPAGYTKGDNLPLAIQLMAGAWQENTLLSLAKHQLN